MEGDKKDGLGQNHGMKLSLALILFGFGPFLWAQTPQGKEISGIVRIIRGSPQTEVFFKDLKDSVIIPRDSKHNQIYDACDVSMKKGTAVRLVIDPVSHQVLSLPETQSAPANALANPAASPTSDATVMPAAKTGNEGSK